MKIKKLLSLILAVLLLCGSVSSSFESIAANTVSIDSFIDSVEELNEEEADSEKTFEESAGSRVIVKAANRPKTYGAADYYKGTYSKHIFQYATAEEAEKAAKYYSSLSGVSYAVIDRIVEAQEVPYAEAMLGTQRAKEYIVSNEIPASSVKIAVIDTGIDYADSVFSGNSRIIDSEVNVTDTGTSNSALDDASHGSACAEIIMDNTPDKVSIIGYKVLNSKGTGTNLWVATGIEAAIADGVDIINLSLGGEAEPIGYESSVVLDDAVRLAITKGIKVIVASGNDSINAKYFSPANVDGVITVGAIDEAGNKAYFTNYGKCVDFVAPGVGINLDYQNLNVNGTSFSAPYIAAEVGILLSVYPALSKELVVEKLKAVCVPYEHLNYHDGFHPIKEDAGVSVSSRHLSHHYDIEIEKLLCYGNGMPQVDIALEFAGDFERERTPDFSVDSGHYIDEEFDLEITSAPDAEIYYTQDESFPTKENGIKVDGSIHLDELQSFRAIAFSEGKAPSFFSAKEYRMEYHAPESDFTFLKEQKVPSTGGIINKYYNVLTSYTGTRKNIICPDTYNGKAIEKVDIKTPNIRLTSLKVPDTCLRVGINKNHTQELITFSGKGMTGLNAVARIYPNLVEVDIPNAQSVVIEDSNIRELYLPKATSILAKGAKCLKSVYAPSLPQIKDLGYFENCYSLQDLYVCNLSYIGRHAFMNCYKLRDFSMDYVKYIGENALASTYCITRLICPSLEEISGLNPFVGCNAEVLYAPQLRTATYYIGSYSTIKDSGQTFDYSYHKVRLIVSSNWTFCQRDGEGYEWDPFTNERYFYHHEVDIYGTPNTYAEEYANQFHLEFIPLPLLESEPEDMGYQSDGNITANVLGFNKQVQWYGTNRKDNHGGMALSGETGETLDTSKYNYRYYYCKVKTSDGDYKKDIVTGISDLSFYDYQKDKSINVNDISLLLRYLGKKVNTSNKQYDINEDGVIDIADLSILLSSEVYGKTY